MNNPVVGIFGAILVVAAIFFAFAAYEEGRPTGVESFATGVITLGAAFDSRSRDQADRDLENMERQRLRRSLPYYGIAFLSGVVGVSLLAQYAREASRNRESRREK